MPDSAESAHLNMADAEHQFLAFSAAVASAFMTAADCLHEVRRQLTLIEPMFAMRRIDLHQSADAVRAASTACDVCFRDLADQLEELTHLERQIADALSQGSARPPAIPATWPMPVSAEQLRQKAGEWGLPFDGSAAHLAAINAKAARVGHPGFALRQPGR